MSPVIRFLLLSLAILSHARGTGCELPDKLRDRLAPGMVVFIGRQSSVAAAENRTRAVTFEVQERLWGLSNEKTVTIKFFSTYGLTDKPLFFAVTNRPHSLASCDNGILMLPPYHPWVSEFRGDAASRKPARAIVEATTRTGYPILGAHVRLSGNGRVFEGSSREPLVDLGTVPPGEYDLAITRSSFLLAEEDRRVSLLPGSYVHLSPRMISPAAVSGRIVDFRGKPVTNALFYLRGMAQVSPPYDSIWDAGVEWVRSWIGTERSSKQSIQVSHWVRTDSDGRFQVPDVYPGRYYLFSDHYYVNQEAGIPLPKTYYPGVYEWKQASAIVVRGGQSIEGILFHLPNFGKRRRLDIQVMSEDGAPVAGAVVQNGGHDADNERGGNTGPLINADGQGRASFELWPVSDYRVLVSTPSSNPNFLNTIDIPAGTSDLHRVVVIKGLRLLK